MREIFREETLEVHRPRNTSLGRGRGEIVSKERTVLYSTGTVHVVIGEGNKMIDGL